MKNLFPLTWRVLLGTSLGMTLACSASAQTAGPTPAPVPPSSAHEMAVNAERIDFTSKINGRAYRLYISIPARPVPPGGFAVVYLIDGNLHFGITVDTARIQARWPDVRDPVVVGIGYPTDSVLQSLEVRNEDLTTPPADGYLKHGWMAKMPAGNTRYGRMDDYLRVVDEEIKPLVERLVPVDRNDQTLMGHSLGGLTTLHALFTRPGSFQQYVAISPSIWWNDRDLLQLEAPFVAKLKAGEVNARVMISVGGEESSHRPIPASMPFAQADFNAMTDDTRMVPNAVELGARLAALAGPKFEVQTVVLPDDSHNSAPAAGIGRGIRFALKRP